MHIRVVVKVVTLTTELRMLSNIEFTEHPDTLPRGIRVLGKFSCSCIFIREPGMLGPVHYLGKE